MPSLLQLVLLSAAVAGWSGPSVTPAFNKHGISTLLVDGTPTAPAFLVLGNPIDGGTGAAAWSAAWEAEVKAADAAGVRIFGICPVEQPLDVHAPAASPQVE